jgi:hypothetical protein
MTFRRMFRSSTPWFAFLFRHQRIDWVHIPRKDKKADQMVKPVFLRIVNQYTHSVIWSDQWKKCLTL